MKEIGGSCCPQAQDFKFIRVKRQVVADDEGRRVALQLIEESPNVLYNAERAEKTVQSMVNATVSHDIRNPVNAIHCQNLTLKMLAERIGDLIEN